MNKYNQWNNLKQRINFYKNYNHPRIRDIWWLHMGMNIGSEIYGKGSGYVRPVLVIKVNTNNFIGLPISSRIKNRKDRFTINTFDGKVHSVILSQIKTFDNKRLLNKIYKIPRTQYVEILQKLINMITAGFL